MPRKAPHITVAFLREQLDYNPETGDVWWIVRRRGVTAFTPIRSRRKNYYRVMINRRTYPLHHVAWALHTGEWFPLDGEIDHRNLNALDNRFDNMRPADRGQNSSNRRKMNFKRGLTSQYKGVCWDKHHRRWKATIYDASKAHLLGYFSNEIDAHLAYCRAATELKGEFARLT